MTPVRRRTLFSIAGFDPRGPRHYHALYTKNARRQARTAGYAITLGAAERIDPHRVRWPAVWTGPDGNRVETEQVFLDWSDIVAANWSEPRWKVTGEVAAASVRLVASGALWKSFTWSWAGALALALPGLMLVILPALALVAAGLGLAADTIAGRVAGLGIAALLALLLWRADARLQPAWLGRTMRFLHVYARRGPALAARIDAFADAIAAAIDDPANDEVLVVGHSYGTVVAVDCLAAALARSTSGRRVSLLTLGQIIPSQAWMPGAGALAGKVAALATDPRLDWVDFSSPSDGACGAMADPYTMLTGKRAATGNPKILNPMFYEIMPPRRFARATRDYNATHFQYLLASRRPDLYDYYAMTMGDATLADRWADRPSVRDFTRLRFGAAKRVR